MGPPCFDPGSIAKWRLSRFEAALALPARRASASAPARASLEACRAKERRRVSNASSMSTATARDSLNSNIFSRSRNIINEWSSQL
eukprot:5473666-Pyramimonas_sp.AAC.1